MRPQRIKGKPAQTYLRPDRKWIFGQPPTLLLSFFDPDRNTFACLVFQFDPRSFPDHNRYHAERAHWSDSMDRLDIRAGGSA